MDLIPEKTFSFHFRLYMFGFSKMSADIYMYNDTPLQTLADILLIKEGHICENEK